MIGKCPVCKEMLDEKDIEDRALRGFLCKHYVYVCRKCESIIGFAIWGGT